MTTDPSATTNGTSNNEASLNIQPVSFDTSYPTGSFLPGGLTPSPSPNPHTTGFKLNHFMLRIRSPAASLHFYVSLMGMRSVFTMNTGPFTIYYLGYPDASSPARSAEATPEDLKEYGQQTCAKLQHTLGLLELYHVHGSEKQPEGWIATGNDPLREPTERNPGIGLGFGHLGFTVPDVRSTLTYLRANEVKVIKDVGKGSSTRRTVPLCEEEEKLGVGVGGYGPDGEGKGELVQLREEYAKVFDEIAFVSDPDGYTVELVPQGVDPLA